MLEFTTKPTPGQEKADRVPLFSVDGVGYGMRSDLTAAFALEAVEYISRHGGAAGLTWMMRRVVGDAAVEALYRAKDVRREDIRALEKIVSEHVMGALEESEAGKDSGNE